MLNIVVTLVNGGHMPVAPYSGMIWKSHDYLHVPMTPDSVLPRLADRFHGFSIGDFYIYLGLVLSAVYWSFRLIAWVCRKTTLLLVNFRTVAQNRRSGQGGFV